jgi:hypothetical protein
MAMKLILLDVDGILADLFSGACRLFGEDPEALYRRPDMRYDFWKLFADALTDSDFYAEVRGAGRGFWTGLEPYPKARVIYDVCSALAPTVFCTACISDPECPGGKFAWLSKFTGKPSFGYHITRLKHHLAGPGRLLVDDKNENCADFVEAGGAAILYPRPWNQRRDEDGPKAHLKVLGEVAEWARAS